MYGGKRRRNYSKSVPPKKYVKVSETSTRPVYTNTKPQTYMRPNIVSTELKSLDTALPNAFVVNTPVFGTNDFYCLNLLQLGSGFYNRIGNKINMKSLMLRLRIQVSGAVSSNTTLLRFMLIYDKNNNGNPPSLNEIISNYNQNGAEDNSLLSGLNLTYRDRFEILMDYMVNLPPVTVGGNLVLLGGTSEKFYINKYIRLKDRPAIYKGNDTPATIANITSGALYLLPLSQYSGTDCPYTIIGSTRLRYVD